MDHVLSSRGNFLLLSSESWSKRNFNQLVWLPINAALQKLFIYYGLLYTLQLLSSFAHGFKLETYIMMVRILLTKLQHSFFLAGEYSFAIPVLMHRKFRLMVLMIQIRHKKILEGYIAWFNLQRAFDTSHATIVHERPNGLYAPSP